MEGMETLLVGFICEVGTARSCYVEVIRLAKAGKHEEAKAKMKEGQEHFKQGHKVHSDLLAKNSEGELEISLLVLHGEDLLMSAETLGILADLELSGDGWSEL